MARRGRPKHPDILTPREWEVLALIRENLTNDQIAQRLGIGAEGVKYHVSEILGKLGLSSREEAATWDPRQRPDSTPRWDPTRRPAWATALVPFGFFWRGLTGSLARLAGSLATVTSVVVGVGVVAGLTVLGVLVLHTRGSANDASAMTPGAVGQSTATGKIAFVSRLDGNDVGLAENVYVVNADGSGLTNVSNGTGADYFPTWSPDGSRIAFISNREGNWEVYVVDADGSGLTNLSNNPGDDGGTWYIVPFSSSVHEVGLALAWSPDGSRVAFNSDRAGNREVYVVNADGSGQTNLSNNPGDDSLGAWSPDGSRITFNSDRNGNHEVYVVAADGSGQTRLSNGPGDDSFDAWSPDDSRIAFTSNRDGNYEIYVVNADGSALTNLSKDPAFDSFRAWSPDASRIAFVRWFADNGGIYVVNADGSGQTNIFHHPGSPDGADDLVGWSPDGSRITVFSYGDGNKWQIYVVNADGSGLTSLTHSPGDEDALASALSPDGSRVAFTSTRDGNYEVYVMNADGSGLTNLTNNPGQDGAEGHQGLAALAWSPDGSRISFLSDRDGDWEIYVMNADGSGQTNLTNTRGADYDPVWSPAP